MNSFRYAVKPRYVPELDLDYQPIAVANREYKKELSKSKDVNHVSIALVRNEGLISVYKTQVFGDKSKQLDNIIYIDRLVKSLIWIKGGWKVIFGGPQYLGEYLNEAYSIGGSREFDAKFMTRVYEKPFIVEIVKTNEVPNEYENTKPIGRNLDGCRIGFDAGGSDRKASAVIDGKAVYSEEVVWHPKSQSDPKYHYDGILNSMKKAASKMPRVDAIGISAAGIYVNNRVMVASLFLKVPEVLFNDKVKDMFFDIQKEMGNVPIKVVNDGDVTALAGAMSLEDNMVLGIAMGTAEAAGYVDIKGNITGWLNELAFVPVDYNPVAMIDEWSGDYGCGVKYFSQDAVIKLAPKAGIKLDENLSPAEKLKIVQDLMKNGDIRARKIFESIGCYLGYALAYYAEFYAIKHVLLLGRVTSGEGGNIMLDKAKEVLKNEFLKLYNQMKLTIPREKDRRVGQSIAAASLTKI